MALVLSTILSWHYIKGGWMLGCGGGDLVLNSRWSTIAGVLPVSGLAVGAYLAMLVAVFSIGPATEATIRPLAWKVLLILAGSVAGSAVWFTFLQKWVIGDFCFYCLTTHIIGLLLAALIIWRAIRESDSHSNDILRTHAGIVGTVSPATQRRAVGFLPFINYALVGLVLAGIMVAGQAGFSSTTVYRNGESQNDLPSIDYHAVPTVGSPDAQYIVTLLFDYECPHCQELQLMLHEAIRRYNGKLAFALCPTPLNTKCNPYVPRNTNAFENSCELARIALAVWLANREAFSVFGSWMFTYESGNSWRPRSLESARAKAMELVGKVKFDAAWTDPWIEQYMRICVRIYGQTIQNGNGGVPKMIFGTQWVIPEPHNTDDLVLILQKSLGLPKP